MSFLTKLYTLCNKTILTGRMSSFQRCYCNIKSTIPKDQLKDEYLRNVSLQKMKQRIQNERNYKSRTMFNYFTALVIFMGGMGFAFVPLFNAYCRATNYGGTLTIDLSRDKTKNMKRIEDMMMTISFNADKNSYLNWRFQPLQHEINVSPGETVLAFYSAENPSDRPISGISTYNVVPFEAAKYFNKIQCFCFDEQRLNPHEQVDMPVFFYIDPDIVNDPYLYGIKHITLSYTFFEAIEGLDLPFMSSFVDDEEE